MYGLEEPKLLEAPLVETTANKAQLEDTLVLLDCLIDKQKRKKSKKEGNFENPNPFGGGGSISITFISINKFKKTGCDEKKCPPPPDTTTNVPV